MSFSSFRPQPRRPQRNPRRQLADQQYGAGRSSSNRSSTSRSSNNRSNTNRSSTNRSGTKYPAPSSRQTRPSAQSKRRKVNRSSHHPDWIALGLQALRAFKAPQLPQSQTLAPARPRIVIVWSILLIGMLLLLINLFRIQVLQGTTLQERAKAQQVIYLNANVPRRPITDRSGTVLAIDQPVYTLYAHPVLFQKNRSEIATQIAPIVKQTPGDLAKLFDQGESGLRIVDGLTEDLAREISEFGFDGIELVPEQQRLYPQQDLFAGIVGYVNVDRKGQSGVEYSLEKELQQPIDAMALSRSGDGSIIPVGLPKNFLQQQRDDLRLQLTLDSRLQRATRLALQQQMDKYKAKRGAVLVMDVQDGSLLSMVSEPSYDPNRYYEADLERLRNWVLSDLYEPGSTFKPINVAIALQAGSIHATDTFYDEGALQIGEWTVQNSDFDSNGGRGQLSVAEILQYSSNVGMVHIMQTLEPGVYYGWLSRLGLDGKTGIDLPSEAAGQMKNYSQFTNAVIEPATTAFGQGFSLTPIKLIQLQSMLANGGKMVTPHVVKGLVDAEGTVNWKPDRPDPQPMFSAETADTVLKMMEQVVVDGTGKSAQIPGYRIAGKTGTAQKASPTGGYTSARITSFVSLFPVDAPRYAVLAVVDEPQGDDAYGSTVAAPVVKAVMEAMIRLEHIPPSQFPDESEASEAEEQPENRQELPGNYTNWQPELTPGSEPQGDDTGHEVQPYGNYGNNYPIDNNASIEPYPPQDYTTPDVAPSTPVESWPNDANSAIESYSEPYSESYSEPYSEPYSDYAEPAPESIPPDPTLDPYAEPIEEGIEPAADAPDW